MPNQPTKGVFTYSHPSKNSNRCSKDRPQRHPTPLDILLLPPLPKGQKPKKNPSLPHTFPHNPVSTVFCIHRISHHPKKEELGTLCVFWYPPPPPHPPFSTLPSPFLVQGFASDGMSQHNNNNNVLPHALFSLCFSFLFPRSLPPHPHSHPPPQPAVYVKITLLLFVCVCVLFF